MPHLCPNQNKSLKIFAEEEMRIFVSALSSYHKKGTELVMKIYIGDNQYLPIQESIRVLLKNLGLNMNESRPALRRHTSVHHL